MRSTDTETIIKGWLSECQRTSQEDFSTFAKSLSENEETSTAIFRVLEDRIKYAESIELVVGQLYSFYQSQNKSLQSYTLQFLPSLVFVCLNCVAHGDKQTCPTVETLLLGMYNQELLDKSGKPRVFSFRIPSLAQASVYHEPMSLAPASLTESALRRLEECNTHLVQKGPYQPEEKLIGQNRLSVISALIFLYNSQLSTIPDAAVEFLCKAVSRLVTQGFSKQSSHQRSSYDSTLVPPTLPRIPVNSEFLLELLTAIHHALYTPFSSLATQSLDDVHFRASHELLPDVLLVTTAMKNLLHSAAPVNETAVSANISPVLSGTAAATTVHKSLITNASFRTKKLPDDIPIQEKKEEAEGKNLEPICEENAEVKKGIKVGMPKLPSLVKKRTSSESKAPKNKKKLEQEEHSDEVVFSPDSDSQDGQTEAFDLKNLRDSLV
ncbi:hyccin [Neocloeon triangulifer]|uniref:hyccin n=1 Tax=Neocloeon triangulifer TaxID=2078957 RepID=UPI00286F6B6B|nr:hyccin [Neocloeon triangulifer]